MVPEDPGHDVDQPTVASRHAAAPEHRCNVQCGELGNGPGLDAHRVVSASSHHTSVVVAYVDAVVVPVARKDVVTLLLAALVSMPAVMCLSDLGPRPLSCLPRLELILTRA
jgi:hypothetical protein